MRVGRVVGVFNAPPVYALGLASALLDADFDLEKVADPRAWLRNHHGATVLVGVHQLCDLDVVIELKADQPDAVVVTLVDEVDVSIVEASLGAGATGSVALNASAEEVALAISAATAHQTVLPAGIARIMAERGLRAVAPGEMDETEVGWLRALAAGDTVADLAGRLGFSEREMYRRLRRLYARIGARDRTDALLKAARWGWLD